MKHTSRILLIFAALFLALAQPAAAHKVVVEPINAPYGTFNIFAEYDRANAYPGQENLHLSVTITTPGATNIKLVECSSPDPDLIKIESMGNEPGTTQEGALLKTVYLFNVKIVKGTQGGRPGAESRIYVLKLHLQYLKENLVFKFVNLSVGVRSKGKLVITNEAEGEAQPAGGEAKDEREPRLFKSGVENNYTLSLYNDYPDYTVNIRKIEIKSYPPELIDAPNNIHVIDYADEPLSLSPNGSKNVPVKIKLKGMSLGNFIGGFSDNSSLDFTVYYDDSNDRNISDLKYTGRIRVKPRDSVLIGWMFFGIAIGTVAKFGLQRMQQQGIITRSEKLKFVFYTAMAGLVVSLVAMMGEIRIVAFNQTGSYDKPLVISIIGAAAALGGVQFLYGWIKSLLPQTSSAGGDKSGNQVAKGEANDSASKK